MRARWLIGGWLVLGGALWVGIFELYVDHGVDRFLRYQAEAELGLREAVPMTMVLADARRSGALCASLWTAIVVGAGWGSVTLSSRRVSRDGSS